MANNDLLNELFAKPAGGVRVEPLPSVRRRSVHQTGMIRGERAFAALVAVVQFISILLIVLSVLGTFYGVRGMRAPILNLGRVILDIIADPQLLGLALLGQGLLSVVQWGGRWGALRVHRVFWLLYFASLALSVYWNWQAYGATMTAAMQMPWLIALGVIIGGDVLPEFALVFD